MAKTGEVRPFGKSRVPGRRFVAPGLPTQSELMASTQRALLTRYEQLAYPVREPSNDAERDALARVTEIYRVELTRRGVEL